MKTLPLVCVLILSFSLTGCQSSTSSEITALEARISSLEKTINELRAEHAYRISETEKGLAQLGCDTAESVQIERMIPYAFMRASGVDPLDIPVQKNPLTTQAKYNVDCPDMAAVE